MADDERWETRIRQIMSIGAAALGGDFTAGFLALTILGAMHGFWESNTLTHVPTIIGLPFAALASLLLVLILRTVSGNIELKALGIEFGATTAIASAGLHRKHGGRRHSPKLRLFLNLGWARQSQLRGLIIYSPSPKRSRSLGRNWSRGVFETQPSV